MNRTLLAVAAGMAVVMACAQPARSQEVVADVETRRGSAVRITQPFLDVRYTTVRPVAGAPAPSGPTGGSMIVIGSSVASAPGRPAVEPVQARDRLDALTFERDGVEMRVPFDRIASLGVERREIRSSTLPPYVKPMHAQYRATAVLIDGSTIDGAAVNFGTIILHGRGPHGTIE